VFQWAVQIGKQGVILVLMLHDYQSAACCFMGQVAGAI